MPRLSITISDEQDEWLDAEADARDRSKAHIVREIIDAHRTGEVGTDGMDIEAVSNEPDEAIVSLAERVDRLETLVNELREGGAEATGEPGAVEREAGNTPETTAQARDRSAPDSRPLNDRQQRALDVGRVLEGWRPGRNAEEQSDRRRVGKAVLRWLYDRDEPATATEFKDELLPEHGVEGQNADTWWKKTARPALQKARDEGAVEYIDGRHEYRWVGNAPEKS